MYEKLVSIKKKIISVSRWFLVQRKNRKQLSFYKHRERPPMMKLAPHLTNHAFAVIDKNVLLKAANVIFRLTFRNKSPLADGTGIGFESEVSICVI